MMSLEASTSRDENSSLPVPVAAIFFFAMGLTMLGCAGYQIGPRSLYRPNVRTVYVPIFESDNFRRNLGEWLTEAVIKEVERTTTYKVVGQDRADTVLHGRIVREGKRVLAENRRDEPRDIEVGLLLQVNWLDRRGTVLIERSFGIPSLLVSIAQDADFVPIAGQSITTAQQDAIERLAAVVVGQMEMPW